MDDQTHACTDCGSTLDTYDLNNLVIGTCRNADCRLYNVTKSVDNLAALTDAEREQFAAANAQHRAQKAELARYKADLMQRLPPHLRGSIG